MTSSPNLSKSRYFDVMRKKGYKVRSGRVSGNAPSYKEWRRQRATEWDQKQKENYAKETDINYIKENYTSNDGFVYTKGVGNNRDNLQKYTPEQYSKIKQNNFNKIQVTNKEAYNSRLRKINAGPNKKASLIYEKDKKTGKKKLVNVIDKNKAEHLRKEKVPISEWKNFDNENFNNSINQYNVRKQAEAKIINRTKEMIQEQNNKIISKTVLRGLNVENKKEQALQLKNFTEQMSGINSAKNYIFNLKRKQDVINNLITNAKIPSRTEMIAFENDKKSMKLQNLKEFSNDKSNSFTERIISHNQAKSIELSNTVKHITDANYNQDINLLLASGESATPMQIQEAMKIEYNIRFGEQLKAFKVVPGLVAYGVAEGGWSFVQFGKELVTNPKETIKQMVNIPAQVKGITTRITQEPISGFASIGTQYYLTGKTIKGVKKVAIKGGQMLSPKTIKAMMSSKVAKVGGKSARKRSGRISKAEMRKNSFNQAYNRKVTTNKGEIISKIRNDNLKNQYIKERVIRYTKDAKIKAVTDKGIRGGSTQSSLTTNYATGKSIINKGTMAKISKQYPKGYGSQAVSKASKILKLKEGQYIVLKQKYSKSSISLEMAKRQPIKPKSNTITNNKYAINQKVIKKPNSLKKADTIKFSPEKRQPIIKKGFRKGQYEKIQQKLYDKYNKKYQGDQTTKSKFDSFKPKKNPKIKFVEEPQYNQVTKPPTADQIAGAKRFFKGSKGLPSNNIAGLIPESNIINVNFKVLGVIKEPSVLMKIQNSFNNAPSIFPIAKNFNILASGNKNKIDLNFNLNQNNINDVKTDNKYKVDISKINLQINKFKINLVDAFTEENLKDSSNKIITSNIISDLTKPTNIKTFDSINPKIKKPNKITEINKPTNGGTPINKIFSINDQNKKVKGFNVYMKEGGKQVKANIQPLPKKEADRVGRSIADQTLSASYRISSSKNLTPQSRRSKLINQLTNPPNSKFMKSKKSKFTIEKKSNRLDTWGEVKGIKASKFIADKKNSLNFFNSKKKKSIFGRF